MRWLVRGVALLTMVVGATLALPTTSRAATIESGWWSRVNNGATVNQPPAPPVVLPVAPPAPPTPPTSEGGLQVSALPDGASAIAAIRVDQELTAITLRLAPNGDANGEQAKLVACMAASPWVPAMGGPWDAKPAVACDLINGGGSVAGIRNVDGSWTFPVAPIASDGKTDFVIAPLANSDLAQGFAVPFQIVFVPPTEADLVVAPMTTEPTPSFEGPTAEELFSDVETYEEISGFDTIGDDVPIPPTPAASPALEPQDQAPVLPVFAATEEQGNASQVLGAALVIAGLAAFFWASRQPTPPIVSMLRGGRVAVPAGAAVGAPAMGLSGRAIPGMEAPVGGLGRFRRPRDGQPPSLH